MAHNEQENKRPQGDGPEAHPSNQGPDKPAGSGRGQNDAGRGGNDAGRGGNKVTQGQGSDTGNKGKN